MISGFKLANAFLASLAASATAFGEIGLTAPIKGWYMQSTTLASQDMTELSNPGANISSWFRIGSHGTIMV